MKKTALVVTIFIFIFFVVIMTFMVIYGASQSAFSSTQKTKQDNIIEIVKEEVNKLKFEARVTGTLKSKDGRTLVINNNNREYRIIVPFSANIKPKYWGILTYDDLAVGDTLSVIGNWRNDEKTHINSFLVRDLSNESRWGVFLGDIVTKSNNNLVVSNRTRGNITVNLDGSFMYANQKGDNITLDDLKVGDRIRVKGIYNPKTVTVSDVDEVKDFSLR